RGRRDRTLPRTRARVRLRGQREERGPGHRAAVAAGGRRSDSAGRAPADRTLRHAARRGLRGSLMAAGRLFLIPCSLSEDTPPQDVVPAAVMDRIRTLDSFVVENAKSARAFLRACGHPRPLREIAMAELNEHTPSASISPLLAPVRAGRDIGLLSEAGAPAVADPGSQLVAAAHSEGIRVVPLSGPSSIVLALMASGLEGQRFRF